MNFNNGNVNNNNKSNSYRVRAVRGGKCSLFSFRSVYQAYLDCRRRKRGTINAVRFEMDVLSNIFDLAVELQTGTYRPSRSVCFVTTTPKLREIFAAGFRDRVVHHLLVGELEKTWDRRFVFDSFASRRSKGTHAAVKRLQRYMIRATRNGKVPAYYLKLDIRSFFMSIDKEILYSILARHETRPEVLWLLRTVVFHDCTEDYRFKGDRRLLDRVPPHKSLFCVPRGNGLPIGNLTSQFFANVYLNELDQFVKQGLKCRFYLRYVDDLLFVGTSREELLAWREATAGFLRERLALAYGGPGKLARVTEGADFLGYVVRPTHMLCRRRVANSLKHRLNEFSARFVRPCVVDGRQVRRLLLDPDEVASLRQVLASYLGHLKHANTFNLRAAVLERHAWLRTIFLVEGTTVQERLMSPAGFRGFRAQMRFFKHRLPGYLLFVRVGKFMELYDADAIAANRQFGLTLTKGFRGMKHAVGFPLRMTAHYRVGALRAGHNVAIVGRELAGKRLCRRCVSELFEFVEAGCQAWTQPGCRDS